MKTRDTALIVGGVLGLVFLITIIVGVRSCSSAVSDITSATGSEGTASLAEFKQIETGMTYPAVVKIIGGEGSEMSRVEMTGTGSMVMYAWDGNGSIGSNMNAMFHGGKLISKAQVGLR